MKLLEYIKREPVRTMWAFILLSAAFFASFASMISLGAVLWHGRQTVKNTSASLIAADILALEEAEDGAVHMALIQSRVSSCLKEADALLLTEILSKRDNRFRGLCDAVRVGTDSGICTADELAGWIRGAGPDTDTSTMSRRMELTPQVKLPSVLRRAEPAALAESYFGVRYVFRSTGDVAYCDNLCAQFQEADGKIAMFSLESAPEPAVHPVEVCAEIAKTYAEEHFASRGLQQRTVRTADGICWVEFEDADKFLMKFGVRCDTGSVCFFHRIPAAAIPDKNDSGILQ